MNKRKSYGHLQTRYVHSHLIAVHTWLFEGTLVAFSRQNHMPVIWLVVQDPELLSQQKQNIAQSVPYALSGEGE